MRPLEGVRVLDLSRVVAGPVVGRILSDLGADVVKIEPPDDDVTRLWGATRHGVASFYLQQNAGKRNVCIDFRSAGGVEIFKQLVTKADVLVENYRGGVMDRLGIGWPVLSGLNPRLVMCSITGFGQEGPESQRLAYASVIQTEAGWIRRAAEADERAPTDPIVSVADFNAGLHGTIALLAALRQAEKTGAGSHIDIAMFDSMVFTDDFIHHAIDDFPMLRLGGEYWRLADGSWFEIAGQFRFVWSSLARSAGLRDPGPTTDADPTGPTTDDTVEDTVEEKIRRRREVVKQFFASMPTIEAAIEAAEKAHIAWARYNTPAEALQTPTAKHRQVVAQIDDRAGGTRGVIQTPYRFSNYESGVRGTAAYRGEHNDEVLREWLSIGGADALESSGALQRNGFVPGPAAES